MIAYLNGTIHEVRADSLVVLVGGIGYAVSVPGRMLEGLFTGQDIELEIYHNVREDAVELFGFNSRDEYLLFVQLLKVSGVGPKMALGIISSYTTDAIRTAIVHQDIAMLTSISGIGKKTAERIVVELKDSVEFLKGLIEGAAGAGSAGSGAVSGDSTTGAQYAAGGPSAAEALMALGYTHAEVAGVLARINMENTIEEQVKQALKLMSQG